MTSMPLTLRTMLALLMGVTVSRSGLAILRGAGSELLFGRVLGGGALDHWLDHLLVALQPVGGELPFLAVPGVDACPRCAHVVDARGADRPHHARKTQRVELGLCQVQVLQAP